MTPQALLTELLERLGAAEGELVYVSYDELSTWPTEAVAALKASELLVNAPPASRIICSGCHKRCSKEVDVFPEEVGRPARAFIVCDEPEARGLQCVELRSLERWQITGAAVARALRRMLCVSNPSMHDDDGKDLLLGSLKGNRCAAQVKLDVGNGVSLRVAGHAVPVAEIMHFDGDTIGVDSARLIALIDQPLAHESPEERAARIRKSLDDEKASGNREFLKTVAKRERLSEARIKQIRSRKPANSGAPGSSVSKTRGASSEAKKPTK